MLLFRTVALFTNSPEDWQRLDWTILRDGGVSLYWRTEYLVEDVQWFRTHKYEAYEFSCGTWASERDMYEKIGGTLRFFEKWGHNMDAMDDCLTDMPIPEQGGVVLAFKNFDSYAAGAGSVVMPNGGTEAEVLLDVMVRACRFHLLTGKRFIVLVQTDNPDYRVGLLGGISPQWNRREWMSSERRRKSR